MATKTIEIFPALYEYWLQHGVKESFVMQALRARTQLLPTAYFQISPEQGQFMHFLVKLINAKNILEVGTFTGYSALAMATALPESGKLITLDHSIEWQSIAEEFWKKAQVDHKIELRIDEAKNSLAELVTHSLGTFDLIFLDADKINYTLYFEYSLQLVREGGLILIDNVFFSGRVAQPENNLPATRGIRALNDRLINEPNIDVCIVPIGDGLTMVRKH